MNFTWYNSWCSSDERDRCYFSVSRELTGNSCFSFSWIGCVIKINHLVVQHSTAMEITDVSQMCEMCCISVEEILVSCNSDLWSGGWTNHVCPPDIRLQWWTVRNLWKSFNAWYEQNFNFFKGDKESSTNEDQWRQEKSFLSLTLSFIVGA